MRNRVWGGNWQFLSHGYIKPAPIFPLLCAINQECKRKTKKDPESSDVSVFIIYKALALALIHLSFWRPWWIYAVLNSSVKVQRLSPYYQSIYIYFFQAQYVNKTENSLSTSIINVRETIILFIHHIVYSMYYTTFHVYFILIFTYFPFCKWSQWGSESWMDLPRGLQPASTISTLIGALYSWVLIHKTNPEAENNYKSLSVIF